MIGLLVGIEREKSHPSPKSMGIRTFLLICLLGSIAGGIQNILIGLLITTFSLSLIAISYFNQTKLKQDETNLGLTTEFAAGIVFCLGYITHEAPTLAAVTGALLAVILFSKATLHHFIKTIKPSELQAALLLFLSTVVIINLVPDKIIDPWGIFNPKKFGYLILILASLEFLSYVLAKVLGVNKGLALVGFLGGFVSSTAVLLSSSKQAAKNPERWTQLLSSTLAAKLAAIIELFLIVFIISPPLFFKIIFYFVSAFLVISLALLYFLRKATSSTQTNVDFEIRSPLDWRGVFRLSILLATILALLSVTKLWLGDKASMALSFLTGLFELHGVSLANATMFSQSQIDSKTAVSNIVLALIASLVAKITISWIICRGPFSRALTLVFSLMIVVTIGAAIVMNS
jgi:uncharacterized membrane protein (DUF4010 family)